MMEPPPAAVSNQPERSRERPLTPPRRSTGRAGSSQRVSLSQQRWPKPPLLLLVLTQFETHILDTYMDPTWREQRAEGVLDDPHHRDRRRTF